MKTVNLLLILVIISFSIFVFSANEADPDLWGHLKYGQDIFEKFTLPQHDFYSYSSFGSRWINHEWLAELIFYTIFKVAKSAGLIIFKFFAAFVITLLIYVSVTKSTKSQYLRLLSIIIPLSVICGGFTFRPQVFTYLLFTIIVFLIDNFETTADSRWLNFFPLIFIFWCNLHGGFVAGIGILLFYSLVKIIAKKAAKKLIIISIFSIIATFANPYGTELWGFLIKSVTMSRPYITEWKSAIFSFEYFNYYLLLLFALCGIIFSKSKRSIYEISAVLIAFFYSISHIRHIPLLAILTAIYIPKYIDSFSGNYLLRLENKFSQKVFIFLFSGIILFFSSETFLRENNNFFEIKINSDKYPVNAVMFMKQNNIWGKMFCFFDWAQICIRELSPGSKVFFDGRYETVYREDFIKGYFDVLYIKKDYNEYLRRFPETDIMFLHFSNPLALTLSKDRDWVKVYSLFPAVIYLKNNMNNRKIIEKFKNNKLVYPQRKQIFYFR